MSRMLVVTIALSVAGGVSGCVQLPNGKRLTDGPAAQRAVAGVIKAPMEEATNAVTPTGIAGQSFTYYGTAHGVRFTLIVFDNNAATRFVLGDSSQRHTIDGLRILHRHNIVLLYTAPARGSGLGASLQAVLARVR